MFQSKSANTFDVAIVGAGVIGSATAYFASKSSKHVILLEQFDFLHRRGSSHGDSRIIRMTYPEDYYTELMVTSYKLWNEAENAAGTKVFHKTGGLDFGRPDNPELLSLIKAAEKHGVRHEVLKGPQITAKFPTVSPPDGVLGVYSPSSGILNASKAVGMFQNLARANGCTLKDNCKVVKVSKDVFCMELITQGGEKIYARKVIFTTGPWTKRILEETMTVSLPLEPVQATIAYWRATENPDKFSSKTFPVFINYDSPRLYGTPAHEYPGLIKCAAHGGKIIDPDRRDFEPHFDDLNNKVAPFLQTYFRGIDTKPVMTESCTYTWSPDKNYIIDKIPGQDALFVGCGFSGHGFKMAPVVGLILSDLALKGTHPFPRAHKHFSIDRLSSSNQSKL